jgi:hypothetical protein
MIQFDGYIRRQNTEPLAGLIKILTNLARADPSTVIHLVKSPATTVFVLVRKVQPMWPAGQLLRKDAV